MSLVGKVDLPDEDQVAMFIDGMKPRNQKLLIVLAPKNLQQTIALANTLSTKGVPTQIKGVKDTKTQEKCKVGKWEEIKILLQMGIL